MRVQKRTDSFSPSVLEVATELLVVDPTATLADVAKAAGIGRTTLHALYPTRHALLVGIAQDALDLLERTYQEVDLEVPGEQAPAALRRLMAAVIPLGPRLEFLLRERTLDLEPELLDRERALDAPVVALVGRARAEGVVAADVPVEWVVSTLYHLVFAAWEQVAEGVLAPRAAPDLVLRTLLRGIGGA